MNQQDQDLFGPYSNMAYAAAPTNGRSPPSSSRGFGQHSLTRQVSRQFDNNHEQNSYISSPFFNNAPRNDLRGFDSMPAPSGPQFPHEPSSWNQMGNGGQPAYNNMHTMGNTMGINMMGSATLGTSSRRTQTGRRTGLPHQSWMEPSQQQQPQQQQSVERNGAMTPYNNGNNSLVAFTGMPQNNGMPHNNETAMDPDDELIPTAIVIKNIPFAVKKEQLTEIMSAHSLPLPYAFNYHFDQGVFRGLAFANFTTPEETQHVIETMNQMEISGRKLRVEYKKMLPARERERIEREKRERRGQLEEQHRVPPNNAMVHSQPSLSSMTHGNSNPATSPSPVSTRTGADELTRDGELNMNDATVLKYYTDLMVFIGDGTREVYIFSPTLSPHERRIIHTIAHQKNLEHVSRGQGENRQVVVGKTAASINNISPPQQPMMFGHDYNSRRGLNRAATTDFGATRGDNRDYHSLERQGSFLEIPNSPSNGFGGRQNLREAKSFADLRSHSGSPSLLTAGNFAPPMPSMSRYENGLSNGRSTTPNLNGTLSSNNTNPHEDIINSLTNLTMSFASNERSGTNRGNGRLAMDRDNTSAATSVIGSHRQTNGNYEDRNGSSLIPDRQPRIPGWTDTAFSRPRQNGLGSRGEGELDLNAPTSGWNDNRS